MIIYPALPSPDAYNNLLYRTTFFPALENIAKHLGFKYTSLKLGDWKKPQEVIDQVTPFDEETIFITTFDSRWKIKHYESIKKKIPNLKVVFLGSDTHYTGRTEEGKILGLEQLEWPIDLYLDSIKSVTEEAQDYVESAHYYWTASRSVIDIINELELSKEKQYDAICLCSTDNSGFYRREMFQALDEQSLWVLRNLREKDLFKIFDIYARSWVALGTTTPCFDTKARSMKGFRDWIAPFCNTPLIYDDYPDILDIGPIIPTYKYGEWETAGKLIRELQEDKDRYNSLIEQQKEWCLDNTLERQLLKIFKDKLLT
jgi:hypothetical protein